MNYRYITDFHKSRAARIGASEISWCVPHPVKQVESLAAYTDIKGNRQACTANDLYNDKLNPPPWEYSFPAEMGHYLEPQAIREFIADNISVDIADKYFRGFMMHRLDQMQSKDAIHAGPYNSTPFKHNTEAITNYGVAHGDCLYDPESGMVIHKTSNVGQSTPGNIESGFIIKKNGLTIDLSKPFLIEAKSARRYTVKARDKDKYLGYDLTMKQWQGVPLKNYFQVQYQMALYGVDVCYIALIFDTSEKYFWQIKANKKHQRELIQIAEYMKKCIDTNTPPKQLVMNSKDIQYMYPKIQEDFRELQGKELEETIEVAIMQRYAAEQEKMWKRKKEDAAERMSIHLKDTTMLKGMVNGRLQTISRWKETGGGMRLMGLGKIKEREDSKRIMRYLEKNKLLKEAKSGLNPSVVIKSDELEDYKDGKSKNEK